jgi:hypothetical protein
LNALMVANVVVWDIETVPRPQDANGHETKRDEEIRVPDLPAILS